MQTSGAAAATTDPKCKFCGKQVSEDNAANDFHVVIVIEDRLQAELFRVHIFRRHLGWPFNELSETDVHLYQGKLSMQEMVVYYYNDSSRDIIFTEFISTSMTLQDGGYKGK